MNDQLELFEHLVIDFSPEDAKGFMAYDQENPLIYKMFQAFAFEDISDGHKHLSADFIWHRIRHKTKVSDSHNAFKLSDKYRSFFARKFIKENPQYKDFFILKKSKANLILHAA